MYNLKFNKILDYTTAYKTAFREKAGKPNQTKDRIRQRTAAHSAGKAEHKANGMEYDQ